MLERRTGRLAAVVAALVALLVAVPAGAITYGTEDRGNTYSNVGSILVQRANGTYAQFCTGTLVAPGVFLTASHCTSYLEEQGLEARTHITFSPNLDDAKILPTLDLVTHPSYDPHQIYRYDVAVVLFDPSLAAGLEPAQLPRVGYLDELRAKNGLRDATFTAVGYGTLERTVGGGPPVFGESPWRSYATSSFNSMSKDVLRLSQNPTRGDGGTCYGDSGGPNFLAGVLVAVTATGDVPCRSTNVDYRLDTQLVHAFLSQFGVALP
ncbi:MAG: trypsin-like serine protease [Actinobacteria bacterium]|nr:trypsin-like serine protease [Actinomycetota bacterium]